jgi:hypothetical protein
MWKNEAQGRRSGAVQIKILKVRKALPKKLGILFFNSGDVVLNRYGVYNDGHEAVVYTTKFTTLTVVDAGSINV